MAYQMPKKVPRVWAFLTVNSNCVRPDGQCELFDSWDENAQVYLQDEDFGGTGHGDESLSDADPGL